MVGMPSSHKPPIVLDVGNAYTRIGYSGDDNPMCIVPSKMRYICEEVWFREIDPKDSARLRSVLRDFLRELYLKQLLVSMHERSIIICESPLSTQIWRDTLANVLLIDFKAPSVVFAPRQLLSLYTLGLQSALVVSSGYLETISLPIYEGAVLLNCIEAVPLAGKSIEEHLYSQILEHSQLITGEEKTTLNNDNIKDIPLRQVTENIKVKCCFVTKHERAEQIRSGDQVTPPADVNYPITGSSDLYIPGNIRETTCEILFDINNENTVASVVLDSLLQCPVDCRKTLAENIVIIGGSSTLPGFTSRLQKELSTLIKSDNKYSSLLKLESFNFHKNRTPNNCVAWLGGSILGSCSKLASYSLTRKQFEDNSCTVPDWSTYQPIRSDVIKT